MTSVTVPLQVGILEDGSVARLPLVSQSTLLGGISGSGKSSTARVILDYLLACEDAEICLFDPKPGDYDGVVSGVDGCRLVTGAQMDAAVDALEGIVAEMEGRSAWKVFGQSKLAATKEHPALFVVIDELSMFSAHLEKKKAERFNALLLRILQEGRSVLCSVVAMTQRPSSEILPTRLRDMFHHRIAHRCKSQTHYEMILGVDVAGLPPLTQPGTGYLFTDGEVLPRRMRSYFMDDLEWIERRGFGHLF